MSHPVFSRRANLFNIHQNKDESASDLLDRISIQGKISNVSELSVEDLNTILFIKSLTDINLKDKLLDLKYSDPHSSFYDISAIVQNHESINIIHSHES